MYRNTPGSALRGIGGYASKVKRTARRAALLLWGVLFEKTGIRCQADPGSPRGLIL